MRPAAIRFIRKNARTHARFGQYVTLCGIDIDWKGGLYEQRSNVYVNCPRCLAIEKRDSVR